MLQTLLQSKQLQAYIATLETITGKHDHLASFELAQQRHWQHTLSKLGLPATADAATLQREIQARVSDLTTLVATVCDQSNLAQLVQLVTPHLPADALQCYALKESVLVDFLQRQAPEQTVRYLGYGSITECLQHESVYEIMAALRFSESADWMQRFLQQYHTLTAADFEYRPVQFLTLAPEKWWQLAAPFATTKKHHFSHLKEAGVVFWYPSINNAIQDHDTMVLMMLLHYIFEVHFYSQWFEHHASVLENFGQVFVQTLQGDSHLCAINQYHLPIIQQYHLKKTLQKSLVDECTFEPHVMPEVLHWRKAMRTFFSVLSQQPNYERVAFWETCYTAGQQVTGQMVTFNVVDNILSTTTPLTYHWREDIWNALFIHYFSADILEKNIIHYFASQQIDLNHII